MQCYWRNHPTLKAKVNMATGTLLNNQLVLTAAHNVYSWDIKSVASDVKIMLLDEDDCEITHKNVTVLIKPILQLNIFLQFKQNKVEAGYSVDLALIKLKRIEQIPRNFNLQLSLENLSKQSVIVCGFPDKQANNTPDNINQNKEQDQLAKLSIVEGKIQEITQQNIYYSEIETFLGQSGAPIFVNHQSTYYLIGIHTEYSEIDKRGRGVFLSSEILKKLEKWARALKVNLELNQNNGKQFQQSTCHPPFTLNFARNKDPMNQIRKHFEMVSNPQSTSAQILSVYNHFYSLWNEQREEMEKYEIYQEITTFLQEIEAKIEVKQVEEYQEFYNKHEGQFQGYFKIVTFDIEKIASQKSIGKAVN